MKNRRYFHVKKRTLLAIAGCVWLIAGINVARLGILSYCQMQSVSVIHILLSIVVFALFGAMFYKMSIKHTARISSYEQETKPFWNFFDLKFYCIMAFMMGGGIWLRSDICRDPVLAAVFPLAAQKLTDICQLRAFYDLCLR